jgi:rRNA maturation endonuclease Nob1
MTDGPTRCGVCGVAITQKATGRPRKYCASCGKRVEAAQKAVWTRRHRPRKGGYW